MSITAIAYGLFHRIEERTFVQVAYVFDELHDYLRVGFADELVTVFEQSHFQYVVVLYRSVVDESEVFRLRIVRMGVDVVRLAVGCPAGVGDSDVAAQILALGEVFESLDLAFRLIDVQVARVAYHSHTRRIIASVFETVKSLDKD